MGCSCQNTGVPGWVKAVGHCCDLGPEISRSPSSGLLRCAQCLHIQQGFRSSVRPHGATPGSVWS